MEEVGWLSLLEEPHRQQYQPQDQDEQAPGGKHLKSQAQKKRITPHTRSRTKMRIAIWIQESPLAPI
jgi:hypothetical protein